MCEDECRVRHPVPGSQALHGRMEQIFPDLQEEKMATGSQSDVAATQWPSAQHFRLHSFNFSVSREEYLLSVAIFRPVFPNLNL